MIQFNHDYTIEFYEKSNGRKPVQEFLNDLLKTDKPMFARVSRDIKLLKTNGFEVGPPRVKYMSDGLYELRSKSESGITRIFYFFFSGRKIVMTNGFKKKTQKTPEEELEKAFRYKKDYEVNHGRF